VIAGEGAAVEMQAADVAEESQRDDDQPAKAASADRVDVLDAAVSGGEDELARVDFPSHADTLTPTRDVHFGPQEPAEEAADDGDEEAQYADTDTADVVKEEEREVPPAELPEDVSQLSVSGPRDIPG